MRTAKVIACALAGLVAAAIAAGSAAAQQWPQRPVKLITSFPPGSAVDVTARLFAEQLGARWGQPVIVENRPGGDGVIGVAAFASQRDDHTLLFTGSSAYTVLPIINEKLPYDAERDLVTISAVSDIFIPITASKATGAKTLADLKRLAREQPGKLNWAAGPGLPQYVFAAFLKTQGLDMVSVPSRGFGPIVQGLANGEIHVAAISVTAVLPLAQAGKAELLAMASRERAPFAPNVPTVGEAGHSELVMDGLSALFGWRGMPGDLRDRIAKDVAAVASQAAIRDKLSGIGQIARASTPSELTEILKTSRARIAEMVRAAGAKPGQ